MNPCTVTVSGSFEACADLVRTLRAQIIKPTPTPYHKYNHLIFLNRDYSQDDIEIPACPICGTSASTYGHRTQHMVNTHRCNPSTCNSFTTSSEAKIAAEAWRLEKEGACSQTKVLTEQLQNLDRTSLMEILHEVTQALQKAKI